MTVDTKSGSASGRSLGGEAEAQALTRFFAICRNARVVEPNNPAFIKQCRDFVAVVEAAGKSEGELAIKVVGGHLFFGDKLVRHGGLTLAAAEPVLAQWQKLGIGGFGFPSDLTEWELKRFLEFLSTLPAEIGDPESLADKFYEIFERRIRMFIAEEEEPEVDLDDIEQIRRMRRDARQVFFRAMSMVQEIVSDTSGARAQNISRARRVVHSLVDQIERDTSSMLELTALKDFDDYTFAHSTNVCIYALVLGIAIELDRPRLSQLGYAALYHDVGKIRLDRDLIHKPESFNEDDWVQMQLHPILGAKTLLRNMKLDTYSVRAARVAFEHHINMDYTGYPRLKHRRRPTTIHSRIVSIVDSFDALTSGRVYLKKYLAPDQVIKKMGGQMQTKFDPNLLRVFQDTIGQYPPGSTVLLSSHELAMVLALNSDKPDRPYVQIIGDRNGLKEEPCWVDLSQADQQHRSIVRMICPEDYGIKRREFILSD